MKIPQARANAADASFPTLVDDGSVFFKILRTQAKGGSNSTADGRLLLTGVSVAVTGDDASLLPLMTNKKHTENSTAKAMDTKAMRSDEADRRTVLEQRIAVVKRSALINYVSECRGDNGSSRDNVVVDTVLRFH